MAKPSIPLSELFDPAFLESVRGLRLVARSVPAGGRFAEQRSRDRGSGLEFKDYRAYVPGDDLRSIDWNIYRRFRRVFLRLFEELEDLPLYLMPDLSGSMWAENPPRARAGLRCALALAAISLRQHDSVRIVPFADDLLGVGRARSGANRIYSLAAELSKLEPAGGTGLCDALARFRSHRLRNGLLVIISDFFDPQGAEAVVAELARSRHRLLLIQLARESDGDPKLEGDLRLVDCESGRAEDVSITPAVIARYREAYERFQTTFLDFSKSRHAGFLRIDSDREVVPQLAELFPVGSHQV